MAEVRPDSLTEVIADAIRQLTNRDSVNSTSFVADVLEARYMAMFKNIAADYGLDWLSDYVENDLDLRRSIEWHTQDALTLIARSAAGMGEEEDVGLANRIRELFGG